MTHVNRQVLGPFTWEISPRQRFACQKFIVESCVHYHPCGEWRPRIGAGSCGTLTRGLSYCPESSGAKMALHGTYTMETGKCYKSGFLVPDCMPESVIDHLPAHK